MEDFSLVIPIYNEEERLPLLFSQLSPFSSAEIVFVDDGSCDGSLELLLSWQKRRPRTVVCSHPRRRGQQVAICTGLAQACGDYLALADADAEWSLEKLPEMLSLARTWDLVFSYRRERPSLFRRAASLLLNTLLCRLWKISARDVGSPLKAFPKKTKEAILESGGFFRFLRQLSSLSTTEVEISPYRMTLPTGETAPALRQRKSRYSLFSLFLLSFQVFSPPFFKPDPQAEVFQISKEERGIG